MKKRISKMPLFPPKVIICLEETQMDIILNWCRHYSKAGQGTLIRDMHSPEISAQKIGEILKDVRFEMTGISTPMPSVTKIP